MTAKKAIPLALGVRGKDPVSGLTGFVIQKSEMITGNVQWAIHPEGDGTKVLDGNMIDQHLIEVLDAGFSGKVPPVDDTVTLKLGWKARDRVSGVEGILTEKVTFQNGCVYFALSPKAKKGATELPEPRLLSHMRLEKIDDGLAAIVRPPIEVAATQAPPAKLPPGGPTRAMHRQV